MLARNIKLYSLPLTNVRTYLFAVLFVAGNIILPQLCHLIPRGGLIFLPIYFFTLIAAYKYGWRVGLLTAILSPIVNNLLFGMPATAMLPIILIKSSLLAFTAAFVAKRANRVSILLLIVVVLAYQLVGCLVEWAMTGSLMSALQDFRVGLPGILFQILGGYLVLNYLFRD